jgi:hypothetical protein
VNGLTKGDRTFVDDELWHLEQQSNRLQAFRQEIQAKWADEAARELNLRYLNPHEQDGASLVANLVQQFDRLGEAATKFDAAEALSLDVETMSATISSQIEYCKQDITVFHQLYEQYREYGSGARALFPTIEELINRANTLCKGVPTE